MSLKADLAELILNVEGVEERKSKFGSGSAYFVGAKELAHFHGTKSIDLRLGKKNAKHFAESLTRLKIVPRKSASDWVEIEIRSKADVDEILELIQKAVRANLK